MISDLWTTRLAPLARFPPRSDRSLSSQFCRLKARLEPRWRATLAPLSATVPLVVLAALPMAADGSIGHRAAVESFRAFVNAQPPGRPPTEPQADTVTAAGVESLQNVRRASPRKGKQGKRGDRDKNTKGRG